MKVLLVNFSAKILKDIVLELKQKDIEPVYWTGAKDEFDKFSKDNSFPNTIFHDYFDAVRAIPALGVEDDKYDPPGRDLLNRLSECESLVLPMMNRIDFTNSMTTPDRKRLYHEYVKYWYGVLQEFKPEAIIFSSIPHIVYNFVIYCLAKDLGIKTIIYRPLQITSRILFFNDYKQYKSLAEAYKQVKDGQYKIEDLSQDIQMYYSKQLGSAKEATPWYRKEKFVKKKSKQTELIPGFKSIITSIIKLTLFKRVYFYLFSKSRLFSIDKDNYYSFFRLKKWQWRWRKIRNSFKKEYLSLQTEVDLDKKFIYVPLANQPECSTNPLGGIYDDQILMVQTLSASIPDDWAIYVKETPLQWKWRLSHMGRYKGYYHKLKQIKNVYLVPTELSTYDMIAKCQAIATVTGTAAWEGLFREKPSLLFGYPWFMSCDGLLKIDDVKSCARAINKVKEGYRPNQQKVVNFLKAIDNIAIEACFYDKFKTSHISYEDNINNISKALYNELIK